MEVYPSDKTSCCRCFSCLLRSVGPCLCVLTCGLLRGHVNLGWLSSCEQFPLGRDHRPGGIDLVNLEVQLAEPVVGEHVISVSPGGSQLREQRTDLSRSQRGVLVPLMVTRAGPEGRRNRVD